MIETQDIRDCFPELLFIRDDDLREKVVSVWKKAADRGNWQRMEEIPFTLTFKNSGLIIDHVRNVTSAAWNVANTRVEDLNRDYLVAGALLHDVGKLLEYQLKDGQVVPTGAQVRHPESGAALAGECGMPGGVSHIIAAHSFEGDNMDRTPEAIIVHHCDFIDCDIKKARNK